MWQNHKRSPHSGGSLRGLQRQAKDTISRARRLTRDFAPLPTSSHLPPIYTYWRKSKVTGTNIDFLNNHNFWMSTASGHVARQRPTKWGLCARSGHFCFFNDQCLGLFTRQPRTPWGLLPPIYTYCQKTKVTRTDIDFLNNHNL